MNQNKKSTDFLSSDIKEILKNRKTSQKRIKKSHEVKGIELRKSIEDTTSFHERKEQAQVLIADMFLRLRKKGRPISEEKDEEDYAA